MPDAARPVVTACHIFLRRDHPHTAHMTTRNPQTEIDERPAAAYVALDRRAPSFPNQDMALVRDEERVGAVVESDPVRKPIISVTSAETCSLVPMLDHAMSTSDSVGGARLLALHSTRERRLADSARSYSSRGHQTIFRESLDAWPILSLAKAEGV